MRPSGCTRARTRGVVYRLALATPAPVLLFRHSVCLPWALRSAHAMESWKAGANPSALRHPCCALAHPAQTTWLDHLSVCASAITRAESAVMRKASEYCGVTTLFVGLRTLIQGRRLRHRFGCASDSYPEAQRATSAVPAHFPIPKPKHPFRRQYRPPTLSQITSCLPVGRSPRCRL